MSKIKKNVFAYFNWNEMCENEDVRIRANSTLFFVAIAIVFFIMAMLNLITMTINLLIVTGLLCIVFMSFSILIIKYPYASQKKLAYCAGGITLLMSAYFIYSGGTEGFSVIWLCIFPIISYMIFHSPLSSIFNILICLMVYISFLTPIYNFLGYEYTNAFRFRFPVVMTFSAICSSLAELIRYQTQKRLIIISQSLRDSVNIDSLTGIGNRHAFNEQIKMNSELSSLAYAIIDVDFFKSVNDTYGHGAGDIVLQTLGKILSNNIRPIDYVYRWGGEEFLIVSPQISFDDFKHLIERLRLLVEKHEFKINDDKILKITISGGGISGCEDPEFTTCLKLADDCMYEAKSKGRNRTVVKDVSGL